MSDRSDPSSSRLPVRRYNQRMAQRVAKRARVDGQGVAVCFRRARYIAQEANSPAGWPGPDGQQEIGAPAASD